MPNTYTRVLACADFSAQSDQALRFVGSLAESTAEVLIVHVMTIDFIPRLAQLFDRSHLEQEARRRLRARRDELEFGTDLVVRTRLRSGRVADQLLAEIEAWQPHLVVLGSYGRRALPRLLLGSVAEQILRRAQVSTCVVKNDPSPLRRIGLATDLRHTAAQSRFHWLLKSRECRGTVIHALDPEGFESWSDWDSTGELAPEITRYVATVRDARQAKLTGMVARMRADGCEVDIALSYGRPWEKIVKMATDESLQLLVLGAVRHADTDRSPMGSVAAKVARAAPCSVLVVHARGCAR